MLKKHKNIALKNIALAFPQSSVQEKEEMFRSSFASLGDLIIDLERFPRLTKKWAEAKIEFPNLGRLKQVKKANPDKGIIFATGHLGNFELSAYCLPFLYRPISFLVREFTNPYLNDWWKKRREGNGNTVVSRDGGYKKMVSMLKDGMDVGILFDQNVTRNNAIFIDWFGRKAATTKALALAALRTEAPIFVVAVIRLGIDEYFYECIECDLSSIYANEEIKKQEKLREISERLVQEYQALILRYPNSWFWMHRKWKTTPKGVEESFYSEC